MGFCIGTLLAKPNKNRPRYNLNYKIPLLVSIGSVIPDLDSISVFFNHSIYYSDKWFSHRGALHSFGGVICMSAIMVGFYYIGTLIKKKSSHPKFPAASFIYLCLGGIIHLLADLPTPAEPWNGIMLFWPLSTTHVGGYGHIWWVNETLMLLFVMGATVCMVSFYIKVNYHKAKKYCNSIIIATNLAVFSLAVYFIINSRFIEPKQWEAYQISILGKPIYSVIHNLNKCILFIWK